MVYAYLALLLCILCLEADIRARVEIVGQTGIIGRLACIVEEFLLLNRQVDQFGDEKRNNNIERMESILRLLRPSEGVLG